MSQPPSGLDAQWAFPQVPEAWIYYVITRIGDVHVPLAAMQRLGRVYNFHENVAGVAAAFTDPGRRTILQLEKYLAVTYYKSMEKRPSVAELRDYHLESTVGWFPVPNYAQARGFREFPYTSACLRQGAQSKNHDVASWRSIPPGAESWQPVPLETVRRLGNRTFALLVWDVSDLENVRFGIAFNKSDAKRGRRRPGMVVQKAPLGESWYPMSVAEMVEYVTGCTAEGVPKRAADRLATVGPEALQYICDSDTPAPFEGISRRKPRTSLFDQAIRVLVNAASTTPDFDVAVLDGCRPFASFKPSLRRIIAQHSELVSASPAIGQVLATMFENETDVSLLSLPAINVQSLEAMLQSNCLKNGESLTLFSQSVQAAVEDVAAVLMEARALDVRLVRDPRCADLDTGAALFEHLRLAMAADAARTCRVSYAGEGCVRLGLDIEARR